MSEYDAVVVGGGPNGLAAAVALAERRRSVLVVERDDILGGGARTMELTLPGVHHDICSAVHPLAAGSPFLASLPLTDHGLRWVYPDIPLAHALSPGHAVLAHRQIEPTASGLGDDARVYERTLKRLVRWWPRIIDHIMGPLVRLPRHPLAMAGFGLEAIRPATWAARRFAHPEARSLFAGCAAHAFLPLDRLFTAGFGWMLLTSVHTTGWPFPAGGSQAITNALSSYLRSLGGEIRTGWDVTSLEELPTSQITLLDLTPTGFARIAGDKLPSGYLRKVRRYRYGPAAYKLDYALDGPMPWADPGLSRAGTIHIGGDFEAVARAELAAWRGNASEEPFLLVSQPSVFDPTRAPEGTHTLWVYAHVPHAFGGDLTPAIEALLERHAPGWSRQITGRSVLGPNQLAQHNPNYVGGDITGGAHTVPQMVFRPFPQRDPYTTPLDGVYLCSASTPPGAGVHGMAGYWAAQSAMRRVSGSR